MLPHPLRLFVLLAPLAAAWLPGTPGSSHAKRTLSHATWKRTINSTASGPGAATPYHAASGPAPAPAASHSNDTVSSNWLPYAPKLRGVNLGSLFIVEPWMASDAWTAMGCGGHESEFDCMRALGQAAGNAAFARHWDSWITPSDLDQIVALGLNTVRVPIGYWMREDIVYRDSEWFPQGGLGYLERLCGWASDRGLYIILDLHGAPGAQVARNSFTGQFAPAAGFYVDYQYERAYKCLEWLAELVHTRAAFRNVGMIEVVNEPVHTWEDAGQAASLVGSFYPTAWARIRAAEGRLNVGADDRVHIQMMNAQWGSGDPNAGLSDLWFAAYDDHRYIKWAGVQPTRGDYLWASCHDDRGGNWPVIVGEWSLSVADEAEWGGGELSLERGDAVAWYRRWWAAQVLAYEKQNGWVFWNWKANWIGGRNEWRWSYQAAVAAGAIPRNPDDAYSMGACDGV
ncbi:glycoside hydrolase superfamily [Geopyxis carbonaria]|nr:glycoside hydrolase superfamily [Geopyxis carbonaria]